MTQFHARKPPPPIEDHISEIWMLEDDGEPRIGLPKPFVEFVVSIEGTHFWKSSKDGEEHVYTEGWVTPIQDGPRYARAVSRRKLVGARLYPWFATEWLGVLPSGDGVPPPDLASLVGPVANELRSWLLEADDDQMILDRFSLWLTEHIQAINAQKNRLQELDLEQSTTVSALAKNMNMSGPTLRRSFAAQNGTSPKRWLVLRRIDKLLRDPRLADPESSLADLAAEFGYADQAHLCREMMRFVGTSPSTMRTRDPNYPPHMRMEE